MNFEGINFPVYRRYKNKKKYFKILNPQLFEEIQIIGKIKKVKEIKATLFPERAFLHDLVHNFAQIADEISEEEYCKVRE